MATSTGKAARKRLGTRVACKRAKARRSRSKTFGQLPVSVKRGNAEAFVRAHSEALAPLDDDEIVAGNDRWDLSKPLHKVF